MKLRGKVPDVFFCPKHRKSSVKITLLHSLTRVYFLEFTNLNWALSVPDITYCDLISSISYPQFNSFLLLAII